MILNYLPLRFDADVFKRSFLEFYVSESDFESDADKISLKLRELRKNHHESHFFYRSGRFIYCAPLSEAAPIVGNPREFNVFEDFQFANSLARQASLQFFKDANNTITEGPVPGWVAEDFIRLAFRELAEQTAHICIFPERPILH